LVVILGAQMDIAAEDTSGGRNSIRSYRRRSFESQKKSPIGL
jgi:hypothetical protein